MISLGRAARWLVIAAVLFGASVFYASEQAGEVVTLVSFDSDGAGAETRLWVVDDGGAAWLRAGQPSASWLARIETVPQVVVRRGSSEGRFEAVPVRGAEATARINELMRARYGLWDRWISLIHDDAQCVAVRLDPLPDL
jgi:hypothetical protein